jgi:O-antigen/teichoic acid export membrane protein
MWLAEKTRVLSEASLRIGGLALADQFVASATTFVTGIIIGRACSQEEFGLYMLGFSMVFLVMRLQMALISTPFTVFVPQLEGDSRSSYIGSTLIHQLSLSVIAVVVLVLVATALSFGLGPPGLGQVVWALVLAITFILLREYVRNLSFALLEFSVAFFLDLGISVAQVAGLLLLAALGLLSANTAVLAIGLACGLGIAVWAARSRGKPRARLARALVDLKQNWKFGRWIFLSGVFWEATLVLYPWILTYYHGTASTGVWAACLGVVAVANPLLLGMQNFLGPKIAHSFTEQESFSLKFAVYRYSGTFTLIVVPIVIFLIFFGNHIVVLLYGEKYSGYAIVVALLAVDLLTVPLRFSLSRALFSMKRADIDTATNVIPFIVLLVLGLWLIGKFSVVGVALSILVGNLAVTTAKLGVFLKLGESK